MKIALVRHAQTEDNFTGTLQGSRNTILNDTGVRQCQRLKMRLQDKHFDYCYMSPLARAVQTAVIIVGDRVETIPDDRLVERNIGELEGRPVQEYNAYLFWDYDLNKSDFGVEPLQDVFKRCKEFLKYIKKKHPDQSILVVTHGAPYRALRYLINKRPLKGKMLDGRIENCQYEEFDY